ncbi:pyrokinin-1 receptor-like [Gigantopelta aegis]|uniref:pyrokinin-1 receptor-like n=1 Tax=Gigantopelta aegis TaxID=1735272 RepID=UPI001B8874D0|nr:pyrokinin-1 receptor-like [Gigantopelta aegis]
MESIYIKETENVQVVSLVLLNATEQHTIEHVLNVSSFNEEAYLESNMGERRKDLVSVGVLTLVYSLIFCTGVVGNLCTCIVIKRNAYLHSATNYYLFSLAVSDVLTLLLGLPPELYSIWEAYPWRFGEVFCIFKSFLSEMTSYASVLTITAFTVERYVAICHPIKSQTFSNLRRAAKMVLAIWVLACLSAMPYPVHTRIFYYVSYPNSTVAILDSLQCNIPLIWLARMKHVFQVSFYVFFVLPMTTISVMYILIGLSLKKSQFGGIPGQACQSSAKTRAKKAVINMLVAVVVAFFVCWAPFHAQRLMTSYLTQEDYITTPFLIELQNYLFYISGVLYFFNSTVNPILYNLMSRKFRRAFKRTLCRCFFSKEELAELRGTSRSVLYSERSLHGNGTFNVRKDPSPASLRKIENYSLRKTRSGNTLNYCSSPSTMKRAVVHTNKCCEKRAVSLYQNGHGGISSAPVFQTIVASLPVTPDVSPSCSTSSMKGLEMEVMKMDDVISSRSTIQSGPQSTTSLIKCGTKTRDTFV